MGNWSSGAILAAILGLCCGARGEEDVAWKAEAQKRIEQHRQADARVVVLDQDGKALAGAQVEIEQLQHRFLFGCNIFLWGRAGGESDEQQYRERFAELLNYATLGFYWPSYERREAPPTMNALSRSHAGASSSTSPRRGIRWRGTSPIRLGYRTIRPPHGSCSMIASPIASHVFAT